MDTLWAPWRYSYIAKLKGRQKKSCLLCGIARSSNDRKNFVFLRNKHCFAVLNTFPYNNGHVMVLPYRHVNKLNALNKAESADLMKSLNQTIALLEKKLKPHGFNIGVNMGKAAGAGMKHLHIHIVPRWQGDTNFMPALAQTKVISQSLSGLYKKLRPCI